MCAPHPDDFDAVAVTLRRFFAAGGHIKLLVLTHGAGGVLDSFCANDEKAAVREREQLSSCEMFGLERRDIEFFREDDVRSEFVTGKLADYLREFRPEFVFLPHGNDSNATHRATFDVVRDCVQASSYPHLLMLNRDPKTLAMQPNCVALFDDDSAAWKRSLLVLHASQQDRNLRVRGVGFDERVIQFNRDGAVRAGFVDRLIEEFEARPNDAWTAQLGSFSAGFRSDG